MTNLFINTLYDYSVSILPWFALGILLAFLIEKKLHPRIIKHYFNANDYQKILVALSFGMVSPLSIMSFLPIANEIVASGANPGIVLSFFIAERAYDLQSFFIISSLFGIKFATMNAIAILISLFGASLVIRHERIKFITKKSQEYNGFINRQLKLLIIVMFGIFVGACLRVFIPINEFNRATGSFLNGIAGGSILGFLLYFGPILGNYPVAKAFYELGMSRSGIFAFLTISPIINLVVILLFGAAVGFKNTYKAFLVYGILAFVLTILFSPIY